MSGISDNGSFYRVVQELRSLIDVDAPPSLQDARIQTLVDSIFEYLAEHPDLETDSQVIELGDRISILDKLETSSTATKTSSVVSATMPQAESQPSATARAASTPPQTPFPPVASPAKLLFNLLGDEYGIKSDLQGIPMREVLRYVIQYIKRQKSLSDSFPEAKENILKELETAFAIAREGLSDALLSPLLDSNKPFLIPGGWVGIPGGHAVYFELFPQPDDTVNFRIFNTGAGIEDHEKAQVGVKTKVAFLEWKGISKNKLRDPHFAQIIREMRKTIEYPNLKDPANPKRTEYSAKEIYESLKAFLEPTSTESGLDAALMEPQRAGTCACRSLFAFLKSKLPLEEYQRLKLDLRMQAVTSFLTQPIEMTVSPVVQYHLMEKATAKLSRRVHDLYGRVIGDAEVIEADAKLKVAEDWLSSHRIPERTLLMDHSFNSPANPFLCARSPPIQTLLEAPHGIPSRETPLSNIMQQISLYPLNDPPFFTQNVQKVSELLQAAYERGEYSAVHFAITNLIKTIPIEKGFWETAKKPSTEIEGAINHLGTLSELFFKSCYRIQDSSAVFCEKENTIRKILLTQQQLAQLLDIRIALPKSLASKRSVYSQNLDPFFTNQLSSAFLEDYSTPPFFFPLDLNGSYNDISILTNWPSQSNSPLLNRESNSPFLNLIKDLYPDVLRKIREDNPEFDKKDPKKQEALLFISPHLPSWLQSIRKSVVGLGFMQNLPIVPLTDPTVSLDFLYKEEPYCSHISIQGITPANFMHLPSDKERLSPSLSTNQTPIKHPMIRDLVTGLVETHWTEKTMLSVKEPKVSEELQYLSFRKKYSPPFCESEIDELVHIFSSPQKSLIEALEYFTIHFGKLPDLDYQQLFQMACFSFNASHKITEFKGRITQFLTNQMAQSIETADIKTQVFLQRMGRYFKKFGCEAPDITPHLLELLGTAIKPEEKSLIYAELAAALSENEVLNQDQLTLLLLAKAWIQHTPIPLEWKDPKTIYDMEKALSLHSAALRGVLLPGGAANTVLLHHIYTLINEKSPPEDLTWQAIDSPGISPRFITNHSDFYDPMSGNLITIGETAYLPLEIREDLIFKELFPDQVKACARSRDTYEFSLQGIPVIVRKTDKGLCIEQYIEGKWFRLIPSSKIMTSDKDSVICALESRYLADKYYVWHSINEHSKIFLYDKKTNTKAYQASYVGGSITSVTRLLDGALLSEPSGLLTHFEHPSYIQEWYQGANRIEIELPRFKLSFQPLTDGRFACKEHEGFFLHKDQNLEAIGSCTYPLILKNEEGETRVILPCQHLKAPILNESLAPNFRRDQSIEEGQSADFTYFTYDLQPNGYLESSSQEGYFHLAETLAVHHEYQKAAHYLRTYGEKLSPYSMREIQALTEIANIKKVTGDESGEQVAIALYATYLLATNEIHSPDAHQALPALYEQYLLRSRNVTALRLSKEEELHLLLSLLPEHLTDQFAARLEELLPQAHTLKAAEAALHGEATSPPLPAISINIAELKSLIVLGTATPFPPNFKNTVLVTRPADFIKMYLKEFIKIAIERRPPDQVKWLKTACLFLKTSSQDPTNASLGIIIEQILNKPGEFTLPPDSSAPSEALRNLVSWWEGTLTKAQSLLSQEAPSPTLALRLPINRATAHSTDRVGPVIPDYSFRFIPQVIGNLCDDLTVSSWTSSLMQPVCRMGPFSRGCRSSF
ncbi:MAG: hypothetical protein NTX49_03390 [Chlamydiae bacterium]|nr:hypothetical protein [Chlamydiota bacterium]